jgi:hypothetical protein
LCVHSIFNAGAEKELEELSRGIQLLPSTEKIIEREEKIEAGEKILNL